MGPPGASGASETATGGSGDSGDSGDTDDGDGSGNDSAGSGDPTSDGSGDPTGDTGDTGADTGAGICDLNMDIAIKLTLDVGWGGGLAVLEGGGQIDIWLLGHLSQDGNTVELTGNVCDLMLPDFATGALAGNETYGTEFPVSIWETAGMPTINAVATVSAPEPGADIHLERGAVVLGAEMAAPLDDPWPNSWSGLNAVDHDGDGNPGITAMAKTGGDYAYPRIDILDTSARAEAIYIASRTIMEFMGTVDSCDTASGVADVTMENHAVGCRTVGGGACPSGNVDTLDGNMPQFMVMGGQFDLARLPAGATCSDVLAEYP
jgi:hypothetical protein